MAGDKMKSHGKQFRFHGSGQFVQVFHELRESDAYKVMTATQRLILIDMSGKCGKVGGYRQPLAEGFPYTWSMCSEVVSDKAFYDAVRRICDLGFFGRPPGIREFRVGAPHRYIPLSKWREYEPTKDEVRELQKRGSSKQGRIKRDRRRRADHDVEQ